MKVIFSTNSGNTEAIAERIAERMDLVAIDVLDNPSIEDDELLFLGCPADRDEEITDDMSEFINNHLGELAGVDVLLFGSYNWSYGTDRAGEWLERFSEAVTDVGANVLGTLKVYDDEMVEEEIQAFVDLAK